MEADTESSTQLTSVPAHEWDGGTYVLDGLARAWVRTTGKTHVARSANSHRAICGAAIMFAEHAGSILGRDMCGSCARVWESRINAIEEDPWESF